MVFRRKGYGFIVADEGPEYYFNVRSIQGATLPGNGDTVRFNGEQGAKGLKATSITILVKAQAQSSGRAHDDRVVCQHCRKTMVPRMVTYRGKPQKTLCPFCGGIYKDFGWCFIATAVYGDYNSPEVITLRNFRDKVMERYVLGRLLITMYYHVSPAIAGYLLKRRRQAFVVKAVLNVFLHRYD
ncbi:cold-shock DNA-binding domain-containing protein [Acidithiobacillus sp. GGI-221]|nr:cold-shock DNA-binding domain-containing protein [Acidithiobacillus sp. GGI-221]